MKTRPFCDLARQYAAFRPGFPESLFDLFSQKARLSKGDWVLDIGSGTGLAALPMAHRGFHVVASDPEPDMVSVLQESASDLLRPACFSAEDFKRGKKPYRLIMMGRCFHWMPREKILDHYHAHMEEGCALAIFWDETAPIPDNEWYTDIAKPLAKEWSGVTLPFQNIMQARHERIIAQSPFKHFEDFGVPERRSWTLAQITGFFLSLSWCNEAILGAKTDGFIQALQETLTPFLDSGGMLHEHVEHKTLWLVK